MPRTVKGKPDTAITKTAKTATTPAPSGDPAAPLPVKQAKRAVVAQAPAKPIKVAIASSTTSVESSSPPAETKEVSKEVERKMEQRLQDMIEELKDFKTMTSGMCNEFISQLTDAKKEIRQLRSTQKKQRPTNINGPRKPSSIEIPRELSAEMYALFGLPVGTKISRNEATHRIHRYCKDHNLLKDGDMRIINPDAALRTILSPMPDGEALTFFNLQRYIKHNYT